jgi:hypothetical protein
MSHKVILKVPQKGLKMQNKHGPKVQVCENKTKKKTEGFRKVIRQRAGVKIYSKILYFLL